MTTLMFIVVEGLDGTGKSTLAKTLSDSLRAALISCPLEINVPEFFGGKLLV